MRSAAWPRTRRGRRAAPGEVLRPAANEETPGGQGGEALWPDGGNNGRPNARRAQGWGRCGAAWGRVSSTRTSESPCNPSGPLVLAGPDCSGLTHTHPTCALVLMGVG